MAERKPEFISLMRTIRDVYYAEMGKTVVWITAMSDTFYAYVNQIKNAVVRDVSSVAPIDEFTHGVASVVVDTTSDPSKMQFDFIIPAGLQGPIGQGVTINGSDIYVNIIADATALMGECYVCLDTPVLLPPSGTPNVGDGMTPTIDNPVDENDWMNIGPMQGPAGANGTNGTDGVDGTNGEKWHIVPDIPSGPGDVPGSLIGDFALVSNLDNTVNGNYYELFGSGWIEQGQLKGSKGERGTIWYNGGGVPSDAQGVNQDYYLDTVTNDYYEKSSDTWGSPIGSIAADWDTVTNKPTAFPPVAATDTVTGGITIDFTDGVLTLN